MKWLQTISDVGALWPQVFDLFFHLCIKISQVSIWIFFYMNPLRITINGGNMLILSLKEMMALLRSPKISQKYSFVKGTNSPNLLVF
jgi:hypothetical protein